MPFSPRLKYGFYDCLHIIALDDLCPHFIGLKSDLSFGQHSNNEKWHVPCAYFVKHLQQNVSRFFMSIYILLHLVTFDLILLALIMILHLGNIQTLKEGMSCVLTL